MAFIDPNDDDVIRMPEYPDYVSLIRPTKGRSSRLMIEYRGRAVPLMWVNVTPKRDIYLGFGGNPSDARIHTFKRDEGGKDFRTVPLATDQRSRVSFHASGLVHMAGKRIHRLPIPTESGTHSILCVMRFPHPSVLPPDEGKRNYDLVIGYREWDDRPLHAFIYATVPDQAIPRPPFEVAGLARFEFQFEGMEEGPGCCVGFFLGSPGSVHGTPWANDGVIQIAHEDPSGAI